MRLFIRISIYGLFLSLILGACQSHSSSVQKPSSVSTIAIVADLPVSILPIQKSEEEWKKELTELEYYVIREKGTERAFTGELNYEKREGVFTCRACALPLFASHTKFESGTGWPSFYEPVRDDVIADEVDYIIGYPRTEVNCARCGGHLGHVFKDGPKPTGLRYCINSASLNFLAAKE